MTRKKSPFWVLVSRALVGAFDEDLAWRLFTKGVKPEAARAHVVISGDERLALPALGMISIIG